MSDALLDLEEMEAIQAAIRETAPRRGAKPRDVEATRLALLSDDRIAEAARPVLLTLANRVVRIAPRLLRAHFTGSWQLDVAGAEIIDGATAKEELRGGWTGGVAVAGGEQELVLAVHGGVIDVAAARRCGATEPTSDGSRPPSQVSVRLFHPAGASVLEAWGLAWRETYSTRIEPSADLGIVSRLIESRAVVRVALAFSGSLGGRIQIYARPEVLIQRPAALAAFKANAARIVNALGYVPIDVVVELGTLRMPLRALRSLSPGATHALQGFVDSRVPVYCGGVLKAWGRPVVCRGVLAVQIETVVHGQGPKS